MTDDARGFRQLDGHSVSDRLRIVCEGESALASDKNVYWVGRSGDGEPFGQIVAAPEVVTELLRIANGEGS